MRRRDHARDIFLKSLDRLWNENTARGLNVSAIFFILVSIYQANVTRLLFGVVVFLLSAFLFGVWDHLDREIEERTDGAVGDNSNT